MLTDAIVTKYGELVRRVAIANRSYYSPAFDQDDAMQEGFMSLEGAIRNYNPAFGIDQDKFVALCIGRHIRKMAIAMQKPSVQLSEAHPLRAPDVITSMAFTSMCDKIELLAALNTGKSRASQYRLRAKMIQACKDSL